VRLLVTKVCDCSNFRKMAQYIYCKYLNGSLSLSFFTREFRNDFLELLRRRFGSHLKYYGNNNFIIVWVFSGSTVSHFVSGTKRVHNNIVYNEYISHREHIHMNATQWETLTDFTKWLGREGKKSADRSWWSVAPFLGEPSFSVSV
jgi:DNA/RNA-binding protein KIN17